MFLLPGVETRESVALPRSLSRPASLLLSCPHSLTLPLLTSSPFTTIHSLPRFTGLFPSVTNLTIMFSAACMLGGQDLRGQGHCVLVTVVSPALNGCSAPFGE